MGARAAPRAPGGRHRGLAISNPGRAQGGRRGAAPRPAVQQHTPPRSPTRAARHTLDEVVDVMRKARVPAGPILSPMDLLTEPQFAARGMLQAAAPPRPRPRRGPPLGAKGGEGGGGGGDEGGCDGSGAAGLPPGAVVMPAILPVLTGTPGATRWAGAPLGHHTDEVLSQELGLTAGDIARLRSLEVVA
jgi:crotonobetainyl-CoA:carnitine CoA-transferase CaiB-like acyl-CoA transferase